VQRGGHWRPQRTCGAAQFGSEALASLSRKKIAESFGYQNKRTLSIGNEKSGHIYEQGRTTTIKATI
jgi:hypothetical protein